ncbi:uncharacterized protein LOC143917662 [Arctopsyche grandis]|uniref:uncharacterized protein LOC143917662 n=1 Tax=Arctopsyche grandis TaxID=121162 RepID=UPI00406D8E38
MRSYALLLASWFVFVVRVLAGTYAAVSEKCKNPPENIIDTCCDGVDLLITEKDFEDCKFVENMKDGKLPPCNVFNCLFKGHDMLTGPDKIDRPKSKEMLLKAYNKEWSSLAEVTTKKCFKELEDQKSPCESKSLLLCWYDNIIHGCPKEHWNNTKVCNDARDFAEECGHRTFE